MGRNKQRAVLECSAMQAVRMIFVLALWLVSLTHNHARGQVVETTNGRVKGKRITVNEKSLDVFHGIPFAKPPVGDLRFKHPLPADPWSPKVKDATLETPSCIQSSQLYGMMPTGDSRRLEDIYSEDCLYLSIWKPALANPGSNLAVMIWIYGGGFAHGSTRIPVYNGQYLAAENDVVVVSVNYRMGPLGFSFLSPDTIPGNMGMMDQVEAMRWVKNNIERFGGDPARITLFGQSTGAFSVGYHLLSPLSNDLFNNGILQSGVPVNKLLKGSISTPSEAKESVRKLCEAMNCSVSSDADILNCMMTAGPGIINGTFCSLPDVTFFPIVDGFFLPRDPMVMVEKGQHKKTNILTGVTKDEITLLFSLFLDPTNQTVISTGEKFNHQHLQMGITEITGLNNIRMLDALEIFYESEHDPPIDHLHVLNRLGSDISIKCPTLQFSSVVSRFNHVYLYSLDHSISTMPHPDWMGVPHSYDLDLVFGFPLNDSLGFTSEEKELSRSIMTYWTNFAKSGDPNSPEPVTSIWPVFNKQNQNFMALDVGSNLATRHGFRRHQCAFVNDILPLIPREEDTDEAVASCPDRYSTSSGKQHEVLWDVFLVTALLTCPLWIREQ